MKTKLIILRGNSGSGKTTIAKSLQGRFGDGTLLVSQDVVRRDMLSVRDRKGNLSLDLIRQITEYGKGKCEFVILEGILLKERYGEMLMDLIRFYEGNADVYYFDLPFEKTVERHQSRALADVFGEDLLRAWWRAKDYLGTAGETMLTEEMTEESILGLISSRIV
ncbi:kinase [Planomicrobium okeanokoites]|uniref:kinase n=1 Tax=Planomicrobium okeanokoites TaxID=244 RepID=UPI000A041CF9|nr:kinase [Planomicrobium okeanokoites]